MCVNKYSYAFLNLTGDSMLSDIFARRITRELNSDCLLYVSRGGKRFMVISKTEYQDIEMSYRDDSGRPALHVLSDACSYMWRTTYMKRGHPYLEKLRWIEMQTIASGLFAKTSNDLQFIHNLKYRPQSDKAFQQMRINDLQGVYIILGCGCVLSIATLLTEIYISRKKSNIT
ncbi:hypothetical protein EVAR_11285_1 [Eumeta japonica]|uniref:Uncharacterized protein n=1 Tax=Eumeta variegata TaxID=151549 RepID=A0A4C1UL45_EUMVA|nr:hypothetical protein EVAR_11285_1 [Eumeta japonica]